MIPMNGHYKKKCKIPKFTKMMSFGIFYGWS